LIAYLSFFMVLVTLHGLPLHIIRDLYVTARSFFKRCDDLRRYRMATRDMDRRYHTLTREELNEMTDRVCVVCREEMSLPSEMGALPAAPQQQQQQRYRMPGDLPKRLPCGHAFHFRCLRSWLERQQSCPTW
jgi:E3 ubiquitin-protein ligase synoviolin